MMELAPLVRNKIGLRRNNKAEPVYEVYNKLMRLFDRRDENGDVAESAKKAKEEIFGTDCIVYAPGKYWEIKTVVDSGMSMREWESYTTYQKADYLAIKHLVSMVDALNHYYEHQERKQRKLEKG